MGIAQSINSFAKGKKFIIFFLNPFLKIYRKRKIQTEINRMEQINNTYAKIFSRVLPSPILVNLEEFNGVFEIDIRSDIFARIALEGNYENDFLKIVSDYLDRNRDAIDIGANVGFFSVYFAKSIKIENRVLSIEPTPNAFNYLKKNVVRNECIQRIILYNGALTDQINGKVIINTIEGREEYSSIGEIDQKYIHNDIVSQMVVLTTSLDNLVEQHDIKPGFIKVDTEGAELLVIRGALKTIGKFRPIIVSELCDDFLKKMNHSAKDVIELLKENNYKIMNAKTLNENINYPFNGSIIAIPK